jgi:hypothetical protein
VTKRPGTDRCGQERLLCGGQTRIRNDRHSRPTAQNDSLPASTVMGGKHVGPLFCFRPRRCRRGLCGRSRRPGWALPGGCGISANNCAASMRTFTAPTRRGGRSSIPESCLTRCPLLRTGRAWAASGSMRPVTSARDHRLAGKTSMDAQIARAGLRIVASAKAGSYTELA